MLIILRRRNDIWNGNRYLFSNDARIHKCENARTKALNKTQPILCDDYFVKIIVIVGGNRQALTGNHTIKPRT